MVHRTHRRYYKSGIPYLLHDEFTTDLATGSVNGTLAEPGGMGTTAQKTRTVIDSDNGLSIISGKALSNGKVAAAYGDPGLWYGAITRAAGVLMLGEMNLSANDGYYQIGFGSGQSGQLAHGIYWLGSSICVKSNLSNCITGYGYYASTPYQAAIVLKATGTYYFIKGSAIWPNWTMLWESPQLNTTPMYPGFETIIHNKTMTVDHIKVPVETWLPTALAYDSFTRADAALGSSEIVGPDGSGTPARAVTARAWTDSIGTWAINTNRATCSALAGGLGIATLDAGLRNVWVEAKTPVYAGNNMGIVASYVDTDNYIYAYYDGTNVHLIKRVAGAETPLIDIAAVTFNAANVMKLRIDGTSVSLFYGTDNNISDSIQTIGDAGLLTGTKCGLFTSNIGNIFDNFTVFPLGSEGQYSALNNFLA